ncbi:hypothetical protein C7974DRAFT_416486 [Boeremia exigua]|uniref:uncharacterized protein n=1 Tax=Boeremia exigua TaxID=749465 RepID=UPI001E8EBA00|nr:uncharacterized protein C7974DRAFT_416486 [Boeremia exigua]KAH6616341.1 hypothetical protein C7974DRAFT_416486 [Boeremia exigua]
MSSTPEALSQTQSQTPSQPQSQLQPQTASQPETPSQPQPQSQSQQSQSQPQSQPPRFSNKRKRRADHDAELLPLLQGPSAEIIVGTGDKVATWTVPIALLAKHSELLRNTLSKPGDNVASTAARVTLVDRDPASFRVFVQWMYFGTVPDRFGLSRLSTGNDISNSFLLWTLGDYLRADAFKNRIMSELYNSYSQEGCVSAALGFVEFTAAEIGYCWSHTAPGSKLRKFVLDTLSHHIIFGSYIELTEGTDWYKLGIRNADLQMEIVATIAASVNAYSDEVTVVPKLKDYLEETKTHTTGEDDTIIL